MITILKRGLEDLARAPAKSIPGLDVLRSLAILLVMSGHWANRFDHHAHLGVHHSLLFKWGWTGVDLFFVLSGFLIGSQLWREMQRSHTINVPRFLLRRGLRIWPYYFAFVAFCLVVMVDRGWRAKLADGWIQFLPDLTFLSNYTPGAVAGGWSLSTEEQFYILAPLALLLSTRWLSLKKHWMILVALLVALPISRALTIANLDGIYTPLHTHSDGLVVGLLLSWIAVVRPEGLPKLPFWRNLLVPGLLFLLGAALHSIHKRIFSFEALALIYGAGALFVLRDQSLFSKVARWHGFYLISRLSFAMYLNHVVLMELVPLTFGHGYLAFLAGYAALLALSMGIACVTFLLIESPFLQLRDRWWVHRPQPATASHTGHAL